MARVEFVSILICEPIVNCPQCNQVVQEDWSICPKCQCSLASGIRQEHPFATPAMLPQSANQPAVQPRPPNEGDSTGGVIPYKNPKALIAYYLGILSGLPLIGLPLGVAAFWLGVQGLKDRKQNPAIKGSAHAWVGIGCGGIFTLFWGATLVLILFAVLANQ